ncbi:hypothetical protein BDV38DRAFT_283077 [Aspergillus pseudotamarii]|uniref:Uncharacterized protein n=1 Tax=Aspergillus pseudotamarii TaxID=132259 RepID=A0A5N6SSC2_ASPPS|nr:uncharacterized protein BDV38DRAFT_283077 [Aspergillus pseudotamarii]KAE8137525.1 hypothetical protein BDV38DRAFT_283077 [Aspergillus pseudotamarii]
MNRSNTLSPARGGVNPLTVDADFDWRTTVPSIWQAITPSARAQRNGSLDLHSTITGGVSNVSHDRLGMPGNGILKTPVHLLTSLIQYWFRYICQMGSTFDSEVNYNRQLAWSVWTTSEAVFYTMQVMSAACLLDSMPQPRETLPSLTAQATTAIDQGISQVVASQSPIVTANVVFAVFALGTSLHWSTHAIPEHLWLEAARNLLSIYRVQLSATEALLHAYFCQKLTSWEMILSSVGCGSIAAQVDRMRGQYKARFLQVLHVQDGNCNSLCNNTLPDDAGQALLRTGPNAWCGVSKEVVDVFGQVLALCRNVCQETKNNNPLVILMRRSSACDIFFACDLRTNLLAMDFSTLTIMEETQGFPVQTRDDNTPISHLLQTAEAYRQPALLQLRFTFGGLSMIPEERHGDFIITDALPNDETADTAVTEQSRAEFLLTLPLQLVATLEQIPADSGSKSIHHMLYVSEAAGLRVDTCAVPQGDLHVAGAPQRVARLFSVSTWNHLPCRCSSVCAMLDGWCWPCLKTRVNAPQHRHYVPQIHSFRNRVWEYPERDALVGPD